ncbi:hypothetical protein SAMN05421882_10111, partial [Nitrosomonas communis]
MSHLGKSGLRSIPMLFQNSPTSFDGIILAVVWWIVQQLDDFAGRIGELHHALEELGAHPAAFRA